MKLEFPEIDIIRSKAFKQEKFDFGDPRVIMNILRSKMYSNPIRALCQEVMSNSRDANREADRGDTPIEVHVPNTWDENIKFVDCGPGVTHDRMKNVFVKYGSSTKRGDNIQTGGFGLGAKTPFAYSDTFTVTTVSDEPDGKRYRHEHIAYIDETQLGAMSEISNVEVDPNEVETGTTISLAVHKKDFQTFYHTIMDVARYWKVKPTIHGYQGTWKWPIEKEAIQAGADGSWELIERGDPLIIIDGIAYKLRHSSLYPDGSKDDTAKILSAAIRLHFPVGELSITANREDLDYQDDTIQKIKDKGLKVVDELRAILDTQIAGAANLWEASVKWEKLSWTYRNLVIEPKWNGLELIKNRIQIPRFDYKAGINWAEHIKIHVYKYDSVGQKPVSAKNYRSIIRYAQLSENIMLVEDEGTQARPNKRRLITLFEQPKTPDIICVVTFVDQQGRDKFEELYNWSKCGTIKLSTIPKAKNPNTAKRGGYTVHKVKKLVKRKNSYNNVYEWVPEDTRTAEDTQGGLFVIIRSGKITLPNEKVISKETLQAVQHKVGQPIYGMLYKWRNKVSDSWTNIYDHCKAEIKKLEADSDVDKYVRFGYSSTVQNFFSSRLLRDAVIANLDKYKSSVFKDWVRASIASEKGESNYMRLKYFRDVIGKDQHLLKNKWVQPNNAAMNRLKRQVLKEFPLIEAINSTNHYGRGKGKKAKILIEELIKYVNKEG